jgi:DNA polymerase-1
MPSTLRSCIISSPGTTFLSLDASQIELRVVAILSQDPAMLQDINSGDLHLATAIRVFGLPTREEAIQHLGEEPSEESIVDWIKAETKHRRYNAKQLNFAILYGAEAFKIAEMADIDESEAEVLIVQYFQAYPVLEAWIKSVKAQAREDGYVVNMLGRIRPIPDIKSGIWKIRAAAERECVNTKVQGTAVDIVKLAMLYLRGLFDQSIKLVLQVHDEIVFEVPDNLLKTAIEQSKELAGAFPDYPFKAVAGKIYGDMKEVEYELAT